MFVFAAQPLPPLPPGTMEGMPPPALIIAVVGIIFTTIVTLALGVPLVRYWIRRQERRHELPSYPVDLMSRLDRIEHAVDAIALEVERISESQRFLTKLQAERALPPSDG